MEVEKDGAILSLGVLLTQKPNSLIGHSVYRKPTHTDRYLHADSHHHPPQKLSVVNSLKIINKHLHPSHADMPQDSENYQKLPTLSLLLRVKFPSPKAAAITSTALGIPDDESLLTVAICPRQYPRRKRDDRVELKFEGALALRSMAYGSLANKAEHSIDLGKYIEISVRCRGGYRGSSSRYRVLFSGGSDDTLLVGNNVGRRSVPSYLHQVSAPYKNGEKDNQETFRASIFLTYFTLR
ncbi:hypothetical protein Trydic_g9134 [Trypoxylus dichotomus]